MANNLTFSDVEEWGSIEDHRWRQSVHGIETGQNGVLVISEELKAEGPHRVGSWLRSGVPVYRDKDDKDKLKLFNATARGAGKKLLGFTQHPEKIITASGKALDEVSMGVQTHGAIYPRWLPFAIEEGDIPSTFTYTY